MNTTRQRFSAVIAMAAPGALMLAFLGASFPTQSAGTGPDPDWDTEIRCCFTPEMLGMAGKPPSDDNLFRAFLIMLSAAPRPVGHLKLITPKGVMIGYDEKNRRFTRPKREGVYGLLSDDGMSMMDPDWHNSTGRLLAFFPEKGQYTIQVVAVHEGQYALTSYPTGWPQHGPEHRSEVYITKNTGMVPIKAGEIHSYVFPGEFERANPLLPGPNRFYLKRVK